MDWTPFISALPGVLSLGWQYYTYQQHKPHLKINSNRQDYPNLIVDENLCPIKYGGPHLSLNLEISNYGDAPYTVRNIESWYEAGHQWVPLLNRKYYLCGLKIKDKDDKIQLLKFNQFNELKRPLKIESQGTVDIHLCVSPDCLKTDDSISLRFYYPRGFHDMDFQLLTPKEFLTPLHYTICGFLPPDAETIRQINHP